MVEDGTYRSRIPPEVSWKSDYGWTDRSKNVILLANGLAPVLHINGQDQDNIIISDIIEIGGIEDLRVKRLFFEAIFLACMQADFQGKRILELENKSQITPISDKNVIKDICHNQRLSLNHIGKLKFNNVIEALFKIRIIDKTEYDCLNELRKMGNKLRHEIMAKYTLDPKKTDQVLLETIQIILRIRELPLSISEDEIINGYELQNFWDDIGFVNLDR